MAQAVDLTEFKELIKKAIGARSQAEFAKDCGLSASHLTRMLSERNQSVPQVKTIRNIAKVAANGITLNHLLVAAGYAPQEDNKCIYSDDGDSTIIGIEEQYMGNYDIRKVLRDGLIELRRFVRPFNSCNDALNNISIRECGSIVSDLHYILFVERQVAKETGWHNGADYQVRGKFRGKENNVPIEFEFILYYCKTDHGQIIICDTDW